MLNRNATFLSILGALTFCVPVTTLAHQTPAQNKQRSSTYATNSKVDLSQSRQAKSKKEPQPHQKQPTTLNGVKVTGIIRSQLRSVQRKRAAPSLQDGITAVSIGQLPDITIANSLSRVTGVEIDRSAGEGTTINVRGLPEVVTTLNGGSFLSAANIYAIQPNYEQLPSELFSGADVVKSPTASMLTSGISGTVNLRTRHPWDLPFGWTVAGTAEGGRGDGKSSRRTRPSANLLLNYNAHGKWGFSVGLSYSNFVHNFGEQILDAGHLKGENSDSANEGDLGYITGWHPYSVPTYIHKLGGGNVDVNGDGKSNGAFLSPSRPEAWNQFVQPEREGLTSSFQYAFGGGFTLTADGFFTHEDKVNNQAYVLALPATSQTAPALLPLVARDTGVILHNVTNAAGKQSGNWNQQFYTTQKYRQITGMWETQNEFTRVTSYARNFNVNLKFDNGGAFSANLRMHSATASSSEQQLEFQLMDNDGSQWAEPGISLPPTVYPYPGSVGYKVFDPNGIAPNQSQAIIDWQGANLTATMVPSGLSSALLNPKNFSLKNISGQGHYGSGALNVIRFDGKYIINDQASVKFGVRNSIRSAFLNEYDYGDYLYGGVGASDPNGCFLRYQGADQVMNGEGVPGACTAGNMYGSYHASPFIGSAITFPSIISSNLAPIINPGDATGFRGVGLNMHLSTHPWQLYQQMQSANPFSSGVGHIPIPASSWEVGLHTFTSYAQANFKGTIAGRKFSGNAGVRVVQTKLHVTQELTGLPKPYGDPQRFAGYTYTNRHYLDVLPAINVAFDLTPKLVLRLSGSKNMMPLALNKWGGGYSVSYTPPAVTSNGQTIDAAATAHSSGNPDLKPWRSTNFGGSLSYYFNALSTISFEAFRMRVSSFIVNDTINVCNIPDQDGVVRRCIPLTEPAQGQGATLHGFGLDYRQQMSFLPGLLAHTGFNFNATYAPSSIPGKHDLAGRPLPFPDNSKEEANLVIWYQGPKLQLRVGGNYRSKRAYAENVEGIDGFEEYEAPTLYVDASVSYRVNPHIQVFFQGQNLLNQRQKYYFVWPDQKYREQISERFYTLGARFRF